MAKLDMNAEGGPKFMADPFTIPDIKCGAMEDLESYVAHPKHNTDLGFPGELIDNWRCIYSYIGGSYVTLPPKS